MGQSAIELLRARAAELGQKIAAPAKAPLALVLFSRGGQTFGLRTREVEAAGRLRHATRVPAAPEAIHGAIPYRSGLLSLVDLQLVWKREGKGIADLPTYIVVTDGRARLGLLVEELLGLYDIDAPVLPYAGPALPGLSEVTHFGEQPVLVLSVPALLRDCGLGVVDAA